MANNDPAFYEDRHGELQPTRATGRLFRMFDAQAKELTDTMLVFDHLEHSIRITLESRGEITATVRELATAELLYTVRFAKKNRQGAIYTFRDAERLSYLAFEPDKIVVDHRAEKRRTVGETAVANGQDPEAALQALRERARHLPLIDQLDFSRDHPIEFALAASARLPESTLTLIYERRPGAVPPMRLAHTVLDLGFDRWLDATGVRDRARLLKALGPIQNPVFVAATPATLDSLRREADPARLLDAEQVLDANHWTGLPLPGTNGALASQWHHVVNARTMMGERPLPTRPVVTPDASGKAPGGADDAFNPQELAEDPFGVGQAPAPRTVERAPVDASQPAPGAADEAALLSDVANAPAHDPSVGRRTPIGQRHAPWRQR